MSGHATRPIRHANGRTFYVAITLAIALRRDTATHKRLMVLATAAILGAAIARLPFAAAGIPPVFFAITDFFLVAGIIHDWRTMGRVHRIGLMCGADFFSLPPSRCSWLFWAPSPGLILPGG